MPETRSALAGVVSELAKDGVKQQQVAQAAGWTGAYLSQFLKRGEGQGGERTPTAAKIEALLRALHVLLDVRRPADQEQRAHLARVADLYGVRLLSLAPPSAPIDPYTPNFIERPDVTHFIDSNVMRPGAYAFDSAPMSGSSTALLQAERALAANGYEVCSINVREDLVVPGLIDASAARMMGALAARMRSRADNRALDADFIAVQDAIAEHFRGYPNGFALVLDGLDSLDRKAGVELSSLLRSWTTGRARHEDGFTRLTVWQAFTSNVEKADERSRFLSEETKVVRWFDRAEVEQLALALLPVASAARASNRWQSETVEMAWQQFEGQPNLTHQFIWESAHAGQPRPVGGDMLPGPYLIHLDRVIRNTLSLLGEAAAKQVIECLQAGTDVPAMFADHVRVRLRLNTSSSPGDWLPPFYSAHLAERLEYRLTANARELARAGR